MLSLLICELNNTKYKARAKRIDPWKMSPNITPTKKGNKITQNNPGFTSLYLGVP